MNKWVVGSEFIGDLLHLTKLGLTITSVEMSNETNGAMVFTLGGKYHCDRVTLGYASTSTGTVQWVTVSDYETGKLLDKIDVSQPADCVAS